LFQTLRAPSTNRVDEMTGAFRKMCEASRA
jgi:hypothetical protein